MRGCGSLSHDSLYHSWPLGTKGIPITSTIVCPVWKLDRAKLGISHQGITLLPRRTIDGEVFIHPHTGETVYDVYDVVGKKFYPYKIDFWEEGKRMGFNRKTPRNAPLHLLDKEYSRWFLCHDRGAVKPNDLKGIIGRWEYFNEQGVHHECDIHYIEHKLIHEKDPTATCQKYWSFEPTVAEATLIEEEYIRTVPSGSFHVHPGDERPDYDFGAFLVLPIGHFTATTPRGKQDLSKRTQKAADILQGKRIGVKVTPLDKAMP